MNSTYAIELEDIHHDYGEVSALKSLNFNVESGGLFGLIGPDGAGKSTLFRILTSLLIPSSGRARVLGFDTVKDFRQIRQKVGYMPGKFSLYEDLSVRENLNFFATIFQTTVKENYHLIRDIYDQLKPFESRRAGNLSGGMKQKLALSCALIHEPEVLFLDEPTTGVDAVSRREFWEMLKRIQSRGITIMVSTPYMDEASLCDRIALLQEGEVLSIDTPEGLLASFERPLFAFSGPDNYRLLNGLRRHEYVQRAEPFGSAVHVTLTDDGQMDAVLTDLSTVGMDGITASPTAPTVEDVFLYLMK